MTTTYVLTYNEAHWSWPDEDLSDAIKPSFSGPAVSLSVVHRRTDVGDLEW